MLVILRTKNVQHLATLVISDSFGTSLGYPFVPSIPIKYVLNPEMLLALEVANSVSFVLLQKTCKIRAAIAVAAAAVVHFMVGLKDLN